MSQENSLYSLEEILDEKKEERSMDIEFSHTNSQITRQSSITELESLNSIRRVLRDKNKMSKSNRVKYLMVLHQIMPRGDKKTVKLVGL